MRLLSLALALGAVTVHAAVAGAVAVELAPDQPVGFVYVDDPLIVEVTTDAPVAASVDLLVRAPVLAQPQRARLGNATLGAGQARWWAVDSLEPLRGFYTARLDVQVPGGTETVTRNFARIDRPAGGPALPIVAQLDQTNERVLLALRSVNIRTVRLDANNDAFLENAERSMNWGFDVVATLDLAALADPNAQARRFARALGDRVARWEVQAHGEAKALRNAVQALRGGGSSAPVAMAVSTPEQLRTLVSEGAADQLRAAVLPGGAGAPAFRRAAEAAGFESMAFHAGPAEAAAAGAEAAQRVLQNLATGQADTTLARQVVYDGAPSEGLVYMNGLSHRLGALRDGAPLPVGEAAAGVLFRDRNAWLLALWSENGATEATLDIGDAQQLVLTDAYNNPLPAPEPENGQVRLALDASPRYLSGLGGALPGAAAEAAVAREAPAFVDTYDDVLAAALIDVVRDIANGAAVTDQKRYFELLRAFPALEAAWQSGQVPRDVAVPAMAQLSRLARALATLQQTAGEPYLEPLQDTLSRGEEFQSLYITGSTADSKRGDWLLQETRRLMDEAEELERAGRSIEATAVATLAEWRARALEFAGNAPPPAQALADVLAAEREREEAEREAQRSAEVADAMEAAEREEAAVPAEEQVATATPGEPAASVPAAEGEGTADGEDETAVAIEAPEPEPEPEAPAAEDGDTVAIVHTVRSGEFPGAIAQRYGISTRQLLEWNGITNSRGLQIGDELTIYLAPEDVPEGAVRATDAGPPPEPAAEPEAETPASEDNEPAEAEPADAETAEPGEDAGQAAPPAGEPILYTVKPGDMPYTIAERYGVDWRKLYEWNAWPSDHTLHIGDEVRIYPDAE